MTDKVRICKALVAGRAPVAVGYLALCVLGSDVKHHIVVSVSIRVSHHDEFGMFP